MVCINKSIKFVVLRILWYLRWKQDVSLRDPEFNWGNLPTAIGRSTIIPFSFPSPVIEHKIYLFIDCTKKIPSMIIDTCPCSKCCVPGHYLGWLYSYLRKKKSCNNIVIEIDGLLSCLWRYETGDWRVLTRKGNFCADKLAKINRSQEQFLGNCSLPI